jgi:hypothetical protein
MGREVFEVDYKEWSDLAAHAQRELGDDRCTAADATLARIDRLARDVVAQVRANEFEAGAIRLGRAIHTLQDECAHHGMTNQEHAFYSLTQTCKHIDVSPDVHPDALACAETRTREAFTAVAAALAGTHWNGVEYICRNFNSDTDQDTCATATLPGPWTACEFLALHKDWDGEDSRWDGAKVGPLLLDAFRAGLAGEPATRTACGGDPTAIDPPMPRADVTDLSAGCPLTDIACLGKVDEDAAEADAQNGGCSSSRAPGSAVLLMLMLAIRPRRRSADRRASAAR